MSANYTTIDVEAYSGGRAEEEPRAFTQNGVRRKVRAIRDRWRAPEGAAFEVETDGGRFTLLCREPDLDWILMNGDATASDGDRSTGARP